MADVSPYVNAPRLWRDGLVHFTWCYTSTVYAGGQGWQRVCDRTAVNWVYEPAQAVTCLECLAQEHLWDIPA